jgi:hypothetical protein
MVKKWVVRRVWKMVWKSAVLMVVLKDGQWGYQTAEKKV